MGDIVAERVTGILRDRRLVVLLTVQFLAGLAAAPVLALLPIYVDEQLALGQDFTANARTIWLLFMGIFALAGGALSDVAGRKVTIMIGLIGSMAGALVFVLDSPVMIGLAIPILLGAAEGLYVTSSQAYLVEASPRNRLALMTGLWFSGLTAGNAVGGLAGGAVAEWAGFPALALYVAIATGVVALIALVALPSLERSSEIDPPGFRVAIAGYGHLLRQKSVQLLVAMQIMRTFFWGGFPIIGPVLIDALSGSKFVVGAFVAATTGIGLASMLIVGWHSDRYGRKMPVLASLAGTAIGAALIGVFLGNIVGLFLAAAAAAAFAWALSGQMTPLAKELTGPGESGRAMGLVNGAWSLSAVGGAQIGGRMVSTHASEAFFIFAGLALVALACGFMLFRRIEMGKRATHGIGAA